MKKNLRKCLLVLLPMVFFGGSISVASSKKTISGVDFAEVDGVVVFVNGKPVYDFTQGEILDGNVKWRLIRKDSIASETFLGVRRVYDVDGHKFSLRSEETRDKFLNFVPVLHINDNFSDSTAFTAEGRYCKTEPIVEKGRFRASAHDATLIVAPGDTLKNVRVRTVDFDYRGAIGILAREQLQTDTLERYSRSMTHFTLPNEATPVAIIIKEKVSSADGREETSSTRYFADVQRSFGSKNDEDDESVPPSEYTLGDFTVSFSNGMIEVTTTSVPRDALLAVMDKAGNIYHSRPVDADATVSVSTSGLPFGQYIVSLSSATVGETLKQIVYVR